MKKFCFAPKHFVLISFLYFSFSGCSIGHGNDIHYFDIEKYFTSQAERLDSIKPEVTKIISSDGKEEMKKTRDIKWKNELLVFSECNLNKPAWRGKFLVDTIMGEMDYSVVYTALDTTIQVQFAMINIDGKGNVTRLRLKVQTKNNLYSSIQNLSYTPLESYSVESEQHVFLSGIKKDAVFATFAR